MCGVLAVASVSSMTRTSLLHAGVDGRAHPVARVLLMMLLGRPDVDLRAVRDAGAARLTKERGEGHRAECVFAIGQCLKALGVDRVSGERYDEWRKSAPEALGAPTSSKIIYAFDGSWTAALAATPGASAPDVTALRVRLGLTFTKAQIGNALRLFADSGAGNTVDHYEEWAAKAAAEDPSLAIPLANRTIIKRFGMHWENAINSVGIQSVRQLAEQRDDMHNGRRRTTREEVIDSLQRAYVAKGEPFHVRVWAASLREQRADPPEGEPPRNASVHAVSGIWALRGPRCHRGGAGTPPAHPDMPAWVVGPRSAGGLPGMSR